MFLESILDCIEYFGNLEGGGGMLMVYMLMGGDKGVGIIFREPCRGSCTFFFSRFFFFCSFYFCFILFKKD